MMNQILMLSVPIIYVFALLMMRIVPRGNASFFAWTAPIWHVIAWGIFVGKGGTFFPLASASLGVVAITVAFLSCYIERNAKTLEWLSGSYLVCALFAVGWCLTIGEPSGKSVKDWRMLALLTSDLGISGILVAGLYGWRISSESRREGLSSLLKLRFAFLWAAFFLGGSILSYFLWGWGHSVLQKISLVFFLGAIGGLLLPSALVAIPRKVTASGVVESKPSGLLVFWTWTQAILAWGVLGLRLMTSP